MSVYRLLNFSAFGLKAGVKFNKPPLQCNIFFKVFWCNPKPGTDCADLAVLPHPFKNLKDSFRLLPAAKINRSFLKFLAHAIRIPRGMVDNSRHFSFVILDEGQLRAIHLEEEIRF